MFSTVIIKPDDYVKYKDIVNCDFVTLLLSTIDYMNENRGRWNLPWTLRNWELIISHIIMPQGMPGTNIPWIERVYLINGEIKDYDNDIKETTSL